MYLKNKTVAQSNPLQHSVVRGQKRSSLGITIAVFAI